MFYKRQLTGLRMFYFKRIETLLIEQRNTQYNSDSIEGLIELVDEFSDVTQFLIYNGKLRIIKTGKLYEIWDEKIETVLLEDLEKFKLKNNLKDFNELNDNIHTLKPSLNEQRVKNSEGPKLIRTSEVSTYRFKSPNSR